MRHPCTVVLLSVLLLAACTGSDTDSGGDQPGPTDGPTPSETVDDESEPTSGPSPKTVDEPIDVAPAWQVELDVISQPSVQDGVALVLAKDEDGHVRLVALDAEDGTELWAHPWSPGRAPVGFRFSADTFSDADGNSYAVFAEPDDDLDDPLFGPVVALDLRTGEERVRVPVERISTPISPCYGDVDACFTGEDGGVRLSLTSGDLAEDGSGPPDNARSIGAAGLFATNDRPGEQLGVRRDGEVIWSADLATMIGATVSSNYGWAFEWGEDEDVYVGWMRTAVDDATLERARSGDSYSVPADRPVLVAFDGSTGERLWRTEGADHRCLWDVLTPTDALPLARCLVGGTHHYDSESDTTSMDDPSVTIEGIDPLSGEASWSVGLAPDVAEAVLTNEFVHPVGDGESVLLPVDGETVRINLATGEQTPVGADEVFVCTAEIESFDYAYPWIQDGDERYDRFGERMFIPCHADGSEADGFTEEAVRVGGRDAEDGRYVLSRDGVVEGYVVD